MIQLLSALAVLPLVHTAMALEFVDDVRIELGSYATSNYKDHRDYSAGSDSGLITTGSTDSSHDPSYDRISFDVTYIYGHLRKIGGLLLSASVGINDSYTDERDNVTGRTFDLESTISELRLGAGYGLPIGNWSFIEVMGELGGGYMQSDGLDRSATYGWDEVRTATGWEGSFGGHLGWSMVIVHHLIVGVQAGISRHAANLHDDFDTGASYDEKYRETIYEFRLAAGYRF